MKLSAQSLSVAIDVAAWQAIEHWVGLGGDYEVSGLGLVDEVRNADGILVGYRVTDVFLPEQVNGLTSTELTPESVAKLMLEVEERTGASERLRFWWHYHPGNIGLIWSHTDDECVEELRNGDWFVSTVFNPQMDCRTRVDFYEPLRLTADQVPTRLRLADFSLAAQCEQQFTERVRRRQVIPSRKPGQNVFGFPSASRGPGPDRYVSAEELLLAQEALETGGWSYAEYLALADGDARLLDDGWFGYDGQPEPGTAPDDTDKEVQS